MKHYIMYVMVFCYITIPIIVLIVSKHTWSLFLLVIVWVVGGSYLLPFVAKYFNLTEGIVTEGYKVVTYYDKDGKQFRRETCPLYGGDCHEDSSRRY